MVIDELEDALTKINELIKASKGEESRCGCEEFKDIELYVKNWIIYPIEKALEEIKR